MQASEDDEAEAMLRALEEYWRRLRGRHRLPRRRDVRPEALGAVRQHAFLLQRRPGGGAALRSAGAALKALAGRDPRGMPLSALVTPEDRLASLLEDLFRPTIVEVPLLASGRAFRPQGGGSLLMLPLVGDDGLASAALGALLVTGREPVAGRALRLGPEEAVRREPLSGLTLAAEASLRLGALPERIGRPSLRLVIDND